MNQSQLFSVAVRILGVYLLVQAVLQIPEGLVDSISLCILWVRGDRSPVPTSMLIYPRIWSALIGFFVFTATGLYLVKGAPFLFRLAAMPVPPRQTE